MLPNIVVLTEPKYTVVLPALIEPRATVRFLSGEAGPRNRFAAEEVTLADRPVPNGYDRG